MVHIEDKAHGRRELYMNEKEATHTWENSTAYSLVHIIRKNISHKIEYPHPSPRHGKKNTHIRE